MKKYLFLFLLLFSCTAFSQTWGDLNDQVIELFNKGDYEKAIPFAEQAVLTAKKEFGEIHSDYASSLNNLAVCYKLLGQYEKAKPLYLESIGIRKIVLGETHPDYLASLINLSNLYSEVGQYEIAETNLLIAKEIYEKEIGETNPNYALCLNNLAGVYMSKGDYEKVELLYLKSKELRKTLFGESHIEYASSLNNLALYNKKLGQYEKAEKLYLEALEIWKNVAGKSHPNYITTLSNLSSLYKIKGQNKKAETMYLEALEIRENVSGKTHPGYASILNNMANLYMNMEQYEKAELLFLQSKSIYKNVLGETHPDYANVLNNLAGFYVFMEQYEKAEPLFLESSEIKKKVLGETHPDYADGLHNLVTYYRKTGKYETAEKFIMLNNQIVINNLKKFFTCLSEKEKGNYLANNISLNNSNNNFLYQYPQAKADFYMECFNLQLLLKTLSLEDTKSGIEAIRKSTNETIIKLYEDWQTNKNILAKQYALAITKRRKDLQEFENTTEGIEKELNRKSSLFRKELTSFNINTIDIWKNLQENEVAIEFVRFNLNKEKWTDSIMYAAYILKKNDSIPLFIPLFEEKQLQQLLASAGKSAERIAKVFYPGSGIDNYNTSLAKKLFELIWQPLEPWLTDVKSISYSPTGKLFSIAFHALAVDSSKLLMDKYQLHQYTSTRQVALRTTDDQITIPKNIVLFGGIDFSMDSLQLVSQRNGQSNKEVSTSIYTPSTRGLNSIPFPKLPGTAAEVEKIRELFDEKKIVTKLFLETSASEENLKALSSNSPQVLHIATHGFFLPDPETKKEIGFNDDNDYSLADDPLLRSGLILSGGNYVWGGKPPISGIEDGIATAYEIAHLNLSNTELVVLSACKTALGDVKGSEGVFGLQRSFKMAGVKKMIVSLWDVQDKQTAELMTSFYAYWMKGKTIEESFAQAQADMRKKYPPFYWAAFVLVE